MFFMFLLLKMFYCFLRLNYTQEAQVKKQLMH